MTVDGPDGGVGISVGDLPARAARRVPDRVAVVHDAGRHTYRQLAERVAALAGALQALGCAPGSRVGLLSHNRLEALELAFAVPLAGGCLVPLNPRLSGIELAGCVQASACQLVLATAELAGELPDGGPPVVVIDEVAADGRTRYEALVADHDPPTAAVEPTEIAYIYFTSGSSGRPKGVMLSHTNVITGGLNCAAAVGLGPTDVWLHASPMFHLADAWAIWGATLLGATHVIERFHPERTPQTLLREHVTHTLLVPTALDMLVERTDPATRPFAGLRGLLYGGAPIGEATHRALRTAFEAPLVHTYGSTETAGLITALPEEPGTAAGLGRIGREAPLTEVLLLDADGSPVPDGPGEVTVRSPTVMRGYLDDPELTGQTLVGGRYLTGDLAVRDPDGCLRLIGRKKEMLISGGENVYPAEVEAEIRRHAAVHDAAVAGVPDPRWGQRVVALAVLRSGNRLDVEMLRGFLAERLAGFKIPKNVYVVDQLPYTAGDKLDRPRVEALAIELATASVPIPGGDQ